MGLWRAHNKRLRAYNRGLGGAPSVVQGYSPWSGVREANPSQLSEAVFCLLEVQNRRSFVMLLTSQICFSKEYR